MRRKMDQPDEAAKREAAKREAGRGAGESTRSQGDPRRSWIHWRDQRTLAWVLAIYGLAMHVLPVHGLPVCDLPVCDLPMGAGDLSRQLSADPTGASQSPWGAPAGRDRPAPPRLQVDLNTATAGELSLLPGIGPRLAERLRASRPYRRVSEVVRVRGIGWKTCDRLRASAWCSTTPADERSGRQSEAPTHR